MHNRVIAIVLALIFSVCNIAWSNTDCLAPQTGNPATFALMQEEMQRRYNLRNGPSIESLIATHQVLPPGVTFIESHEEILKTLEQIGGGTLVINFDAHLDSNGQSPEGNWVTISKQRGLAKNVITCPLGWQSNIEILNEYLGRAKRDGQPVVVSFCFDYFSLGARKYIDDFEKLCHLDLAQAQQEIVQIGKYFRGLGIEIMCVVGARSRDYLHPKADADYIAGLEKMITQEFRQAADVTSENASQQAASRYYTIKYNQTKLIAGILDKNYSPEAVLKEYAARLEARLGMPAGSIILRPTNGNNGLISVERYSDSSRSGNPIGKGTIDIEESIAGKPLRIMSLLNIAILASDIPVDSRLDQIRMDYTDRIALIQSQYKDMTGEDLPYENIYTDLGGGVHISLPHAGRIPVETTLEEYYRLTIVKLRQSA